VEDFGITNVDAMACGTPVLAFDRGGARESVIPGRSGMLVDEQTAAAFARAITALPRTWDVDTCREVAEGFSEDSFRDGIAGVLEKFGAPDRRDDVRG
jgi:glycosyltransferase involved in cell wall biosynthesis